MTLTAVLPALIIAVIVVVFFKKVAKTQDQHYDERQLVYRAQALRTGYLVSLVGLLLLLYMNDMVEGFTRTIDLSLWIFIVIFASIVAFSVHCIMTESFFSVGMNGTPYILLCLFVCVSNGIIGVSRILDGSLWQDGVVTFSRGSSLVGAVAFLIILLALVVKKQMLKKEERE